MNELTDQDILARAKAIQHNAFIQSNRDARAAQSATSKLMALVGGCELWHTPDGVGYVTYEVNGHKENWPTGSKKFLKWLGRQCYVAYGMVPQEKGMRETLEVIDGKAQYGNDVHPVYTRIAHVGAIVDGDDEGNVWSDGGSVVIDLGGDDWKAVVVTADGWEVVNGADVGVRFRRPSEGMMALPVPEPGNINVLRKFLNVASEDDFTLLVGWLLCALKGTGPYPVLILQGEQGSAKSTTAEVLRRLVDPASPVLQAPPRNMHDLAIRAKNSYVLALDNISSISEQMSDALCRLATGGGFSVRKLYTDDEEARVDVQRPISINGIENLGARLDLLDRAIVITLPIIDGERRQLSEVFWRGFEHQQAGILGALLDMVANGLNCRRRSIGGGLVIDDKGRMADVEQWVMECMTDVTQPGGVAIGWRVDAFENAYKRSKGEASQYALDVDVVASGIRALGEWSGMVSELLDTLYANASGGARKQLPATSMALGSHLRRLVPALAAEGIVLEFKRTSSGRMITITRTVEE